MEKFEERGNESGSEHSGELEEDAASTKGKSSSSGLGKPMPSPNKKEGDVGKKGDDSKQGDDGGKKARAGKDNDKDKNKDTLLQKQCINTKGHIAESSRAPVFGVTGAHPPGILRCAGAH